MEYASDERCLTDISNTLGMVNYDDFLQDMINLC